MQRQQHQNQHPYQPNIINPPRAIVCGAEERKKDIKEKKERKKGKMIWAVLLCTVVLSESDDPKPALELVHARARHTKRLLLCVAASG